MTYNVFGGTLNFALSILSLARACIPCSAEKNYLASVSQTIPDHESNSVERCYYDIYQIA